MSTVKMIELYENVSTVSTAAEKRDKKLADWLGWQLQCLRKTYCHAHGITMDVFAERVGMSKKRYYELERSEDGSTTVAKLNGILEACDTDLSEFFSRLITHAKLADIQVKYEKDEELISNLVKALSHPRARSVVEGAAVAVATFLGTEDDQ